MVKHLLPRSAMNLDKPILTSYWSSTFSFSKCHAEMKVPFDPSYLYLSSGGEFAKYARLWTRGYDVYTPNRILVAHDNFNTMEKVGATNVDPYLWVKAGMRDSYRWSMYEAAINRVKTLLGYSTGRFMVNVYYCNLLVLFKLCDFSKFIDIETSGRNIKGVCAHSLWIRHC